jgi:hypothetical protein
MTSDLQQAWEAVQQVLYTKMGRMQYFEFGEEGCKFEKNGRLYQVKITEVKDKDKPPIPIVL